MVRVVVGLMGSSVAGGSSRLATVAQVQTYLDTCHRYAVKELDTARVYNGGKSEELLGSARNDDFLVGTKAPGFSAGSLTYDKIIANANASLAALQKSCIDLYYFHGPDRQTPLEESCRAIGQLHAEGKIRRFGVSNLRASEVEEIVDICRRHDWPAPTVYQGGYNAVARGAEAGLFPTLRRHGIAFYAFSPLAGGFFARPAAQLRAPPPGSRMHAMPVFADIYVGELTLALHARLEAACAAHGFAMREAALRWLMHHAPLLPQDGVVLGASSAEQLEGNLQACQKGHLPDDVVQLFEDVWAQVSASGRAASYCV